MKTTTRFVVAMASLTFGTLAGAQSPASVQDLADALTSSRDACVQQASQAASTASTANFKAGLDLQNAQLQAEMDARVYGVGHGRRETSEYLLDRMQQANAASAAETQRIADQLKTDSHAVLLCVDAAKAHGKSLYSAFKADKRHHRDMPEAEALMTAWLTNMAEVTSGQPQGGDASLAAWKTAKAHAEVAGL